MRKKLLVLIILFGTTKIIYGQFDYINEKYNVSAEASMDEKSDEEVRFATEEFIYTASNFAKLGGEYIAKYKRSDYSLVWRTKLPKSWKFDGSKLYAKTIEFHKDGSCVILAKGKRTKSVSTKVAIVHYNSNGELDHIQPLDDEMNEQFEGADAKLIVDKNNYFVILLGYGRSEKADKLICYTYSSDWKLTSKTSAISDGNNDIVDVEYNPVTSAMYVLLADQRVIPTSSN